MFSSPSTPPVPLPPKEPEIDSISEEVRRKRGTNSGQVRTEPIGIAAAPVMPPNIMLSK